MESLVIWKSIPINLRIQLKAYSEILCGIDLICCIRIGLFSYLDVIKIIIDKLKIEDML